MNYESTANNIKTKTGILSWWFILIFVVCVSIISALFFPIKTLPDTVLTISQPQAITLYYLQQLVPLYPERYSLRIALIQQEIGIYDWIAAEHQISLLEKDSAMANEARLLRFQIKYTQAYQMPHGLEREAAFMNLRKEVGTFTQLPLQKDQVLTLAKMALSLGMPALALSYYQQLGQVKDPLLLKQIAQTALQTSQHAVSAQYYMLAEQQEKTVEQKRVDIINALKALEAGRLFDQGIKLISTLQDNVIDNKAMLTFLAQYCLAANKPDLAEVYIKRALLK